MRTAAVVLIAVGIVLAPGCKKPNPNHAPDAPSVSSGPASGRVGVLYTFSSSAVDLDGDSVAIRFDWGDGDTSYWSDYVPSGDSMVVSHSWSTAGTFTVRAQAMDSSYAASAWSSVRAASVSGGWAKTFGGTSLDRGTAVGQTQDGGYIVTGYTYSCGAGRSDVWLIKTDASGDTLWTKTFGGADNDGGSSVEQTTDGGYITAGYTLSYGESPAYVACLIKTDADGNRVWDKTFGGAGNEEGKSVQQTSDGGYVIACDVDSGGAGGHDVLLVKTDAQGNKVWDKVLGGTGSDCGWSVQQTHDGGYVIAGFTYSYGAGGRDAWLVKTDADGDTVWTRIFGGTGDDPAFSVQQTADDGYVIAGGTDSYGAGDHDVWLVKTDANGNMTWNKTYGMTGYDCGHSVQQTQDGGYVVVGSTNSRRAGGTDVWLIKTDANGDTMWTRTFGGADVDEGYSVKQTQDGGYVVTGYTGSYGAGFADVWLIRLDVEGKADEGGGK